MVSTKKRVLHALRITRRKAKLVDMHLDKPERHQLMQRYARKALNPKWYGRLVISV